MIFLLLFQLLTDPAAALIYGEDIQKVKLRNFNPTLPKNLQCKRPLPLSQQNRYQQTSRIINGQRADWNWPFIVRIKILKNRSYCGASIISPEYVVTAAHCVAHDKKVTLTFGDQVLHNEKESGELSMESDNFIIHPQYSATTGQNDIALIKLPRPIAYSPNIAPVCLPYSNEFSPGTDCYIAGWGAQDENHKRGVVSSELMEARVPLLSGEVCSRGTSYGTLFNPRVHLCAGHMLGGRTDACQNDSGGPLVCLDGDKQPVLVGIVSFGKGCARPNFPGVYSNVASYTEWIHQVIYKNNWQNIYEQYKPINKQNNSNNNSCGPVDISATEMSAKTEASTILVTNGQTKCFGVAISDNFVLFAIDCVTDEQLLKIFSARKELRIKQVLYDDHESLAMIETVEKLTDQMCVSEELPGTDEECLSLDSEYFPNFYRTSACPIERKESTCFDDIPARLITNMLSVPIICGNRLVSFYVDTELINFTSLQRSRKTITAAIDKIKAQELSEEDENPFIQSLFSGRRKALMAPEGNVMVTYEYQYEITEEEFDYSDDYASKSGQKNSKGAKNTQKRPKNTPKESFTNLRTCQNLEKTYDILAGDVITTCENSTNSCDFSCATSGEIPTIARAICKNEKRKKWDPKPKRTGSVGCAKPEHQTKCGPITRHFDVDFNSGVQVDCKKNRCWISCPDTKVNTLPRWTREVICRNSVRNIWNIKKTIDIACVKPSEKAKEESLKCGGLAEFYPWFKKSGITGICTGRKEKYERCDLYCPDGTRPKRNNEVFDSVVCHRGKRRFEPALENAPVCA